MLPPNMRTILLFITTLFATVYSNGEFSVLYSPDSVNFEGHDALKESTLIEVYSAALGFTTRQYSDWRGIFITDPFGLAQAIVAIAVDGVSDVEIVNGHHFPLKTDKDEDYVYRSLERRIAEVYPEQNTDLIRVDLSDDLSSLQAYDIFYGIKSDKPKVSKYTYLKGDVEEDREFLRELNLLDVLAQKISKDTTPKDYVPDLYWFVMKSLHPMQDLYGENSTTVKEAKQLLNDVLVQLTDAFTKKYDGKVLVTLITSDASHTRRSRSILEAPADKPDPDNDNPHNIAKNYSPDYPVIFNIILWFGVTMFFALLAISIVIADMDPGRDSIIYRMTSTRMKKDN